MSPRNWKVVILLRSAIGQITLRLVKLLFSMLQFTSCYLFISTLSIYPLRSVVLPKVCLYFIYNKTFFIIYYAPSIPPEDGLSRPKHVAKYHLIVIIASCLIYVVY